jgi:hypothetical protein
MITNGSLPDGMVPDYAWPQFVFPTIWFSSARTENGFMPLGGIPDACCPDRVWPRVVRVGFYNDAGTRRMILDGAAYRLIIAEV